LIFATTGSAQSFARSLRTAHSNALGLGMAQNPEIESELGMAHVMSCHVM